MAQPVNAAERAASSWPRGQSRALASGPRNDRCTRVGNGAGTHGPLAQPHDLGRKVRAVAYQGRNLLFGHA